MWLCCDGVEVEGGVWSGVWGRVVDGWGWGAWRGGGGIGDG